MKLDVYIRQEPIFQTMLLPKQDTDDLYLMKLDNFVNPSPRADFFVLDRTTFIEYVIRLIHL